MKKILIILILSIFTAPLFSASLDTEVDKYWGQRRKIKVIQQKEFSKVDKMEFTVYAGIIPNDAFYNSTPFGMKLDYFTSEFLSFNLSASYDFSFEASSVSVLTDLGVGSKFIERPLWHVLLGMDYSFIYGKAAFGTTTLSYFDMYVSLVAGVYGTTYYDGNELEKPGVTFGGGAGLGVRFYLTKSISFRLEGKQQFFLRHEGGLQKPLELIVGIGYLF